MSKPVLLDNTVLSNLALVGQMDLVFHLWPDRAASTPAVLREYGVATRAGLLPPHAWADLPLLDLTPQECAISAELSKRLGPGERSCLAVAHSRGGVFASDDADARAAARCLLVPVTGTLGILALAVRRGLLALAEANGLLADMVTAGYRSPVEDLDELV
jgi:predicted nucleic acid-binding protein